MENETKLIFNRQLALKLSRAGYPILDIIENKWKKYIEIYIFKNTEDFQKTFTDLVKQGKKSNDKYNSNWRKNSNVNTNFTIITKSAITK